MTETRTSKQGFASMDRNKHLEISKKGGIARSSQLTAEEHVILSKKGGIITREKYGLQHYKEMSKKSYLKRLEKKK